MTRLSSFFLQQMAFAYQNVLWSVPQTVVYIVPTVSCGFFANGSCFRKGSVEGSANYSLHLSPKWLLLHKNSLEGSTKCALHSRFTVSPSLLLGSKLRQKVDMSHPYSPPIRKKDPSCRCCWGILWVYFPPNFWWWAPTYDWYTGRSCNPQGYELLPWRVDVLFFGGMMGNMK